MDSEVVLRVLREANAEILNDGEFGELNADLDLVRTVKFKINGHSMSITWFKNMSTLQCPSGVSVMFTDMEYAGTWPNNFKKNIQFRAEGSCVAFIGIERY